MCFQRLYFFVVSTIYKSIVLTWQVGGGWLSYQIRWVWMIKKILTCTTLRRRRMNIVELPPVP